MGNITFDKNFIVKILASILLAFCLVAPFLEKLGRSINGSLYTRLDLLAFSWDFEKKFLLFNFVIAFISLVVGVILFQFQKRRYLMLGSFLIAVSFMLPHLLVSPPFEAPDEPDHFLGLLDFSTKKEKLLSSAEKLSKQGQFIRIYRYHDKKLLPEDLLRNEKNSWESHMVPTKMEERSQATRLVWLLFFEVTNFENANSLLYGLRFIHGIIFSFSLALFAFLAGQVFRSKWVSVAIVSFVNLIPSIQFFGMHISNYAILTSLYLVSLIGLLFMVKIFNEKKDRFYSIPAIFIGFFGMLPALGGVSGFSYMTVLPLALTFACFKYAFKSKKNALKILGSFVFGGVVTSVILLPNVVYSNLISQYFQSAHFSKFYMEAASRISLFLVIGILTSSACYLLRDTGDFAYKNDKNYCGSNYFWLSINLFTGVCFLILPLIFKIEHQVSIETAHNLSKMDYIFSSISKFFMNYSGSSCDLYLCSSFWWGFGWLEMPVQNSLYLWPRYLVPLFLIFASANTLIKNYKSEELVIPAGLNVFGILLGSILSISILSWWYFNAQINLHGRYLIGIHLVIFVVCAIKFIQSIEKKNLEFIAYLFLFMATVNRGLIFKFLVNRYY